MEHFLMSDFEKYLGMAKGNQSKVNALAIIYHSIYAANSNSQCLTDFMFLKGAFYVELLLSSMQSFDVAQVSLFTFFSENLPPIKLIFSRYKLSVFAGFFRKLLINQQDVPTTN